MSEINTPSTNGPTHVEFSDGSRMPIAELIDEVVKLLCLGADSDWLYETGEQLELWSALPASLRSDDGITSDRRDI